jgi:hypothetical protein
MITTTHTPKMWQLESSPRAFLTLALAAVASVSALGYSPDADADEGGVPFWLSGQFASLAAVPATPGWSIVGLPYYYNGSANGSKSFSKGPTLSTGLDTTLPLVLVQPGYATTEKVLGGQPYFGIAFGYGKNDVDADASISAIGTQLNRSDTTSGGSDLYPFASLSWNRGNQNWMTYTQWGIPTGAYNSDRLANIGIGHGAIDAGGGYTYLNEMNGREFSAVLGATYNFKNTDTDYQNGVDLHLDWAVSQFLSENWHVGLVGYVYRQLTADDYSTSGVLGALRAQALGDFKSRVSAVGAEIGYLFNINGQQAYLNVRGYDEFGAENRVEGYALFAMVAIPLGSSTSKSGAN